MEIVVEIQWRFCLERLVGFGVESAVRLGWNSWRFSVGIIGAFHWNTQPVPFVRSTDI